MKLPALLEALAAGIALAGPQPMRTPVWLALAGAALPCRWDPRFGNNERAEAFPKSALQTFTS